jgi:hypothetical protein
LMTGWWSVSEKSLYFDGRVVVGEPEVVVF